MKTNKILGLKRSIPVIVGGGDNQLSALGNGLYNYPSPVLINIGTGSQISMVTDNYKKIHGIDTRSFFGIKFLFVGASLDGGNSYSNIKDKINEELNNRIGFKDMDELAGKVDPGADGLKFSKVPVE